MIVAPGSAIQDVLDLRLADAVFGCQGSLLATQSRVAFPDLKHLVAGQFGSLFAALLGAFGMKPRAVRVSSSHVGPPLLITISGVEGMIAVEQVVKADAQPLIAAVKNQRVPKLLAGQAMFERPAESVRSVVTSVNSESAITIACRFAGPDRTRAEMWDVLRYRSVPVDLLLEALPDGTCRSAHTSLYNTERSAA